MGSEGNLPTYVSALLLMTASILLFVIGSQQRSKDSPFVLHWLILAGGMLFMSVDEASQIHEKVGRLIHYMFGPTEGIWFYAWFIPYIPLVLILFIFYIPFLRNLPFRFGGLFFAAGFVYVAGAIGAEMVESYMQYHDLRGETPQWIIEESLEMFGVIILIYALLKFLAEKHMHVTFRITEPISTST
jgi:hypothetical protein